MHANKHIELCPQRIWVRKSQSFLIFYFYLIPPHADRRSIWHRNWHSSGSTRLVASRLCNPSLWAITYSKKYRHVRYSTVVCFSVLSASANLIILKNVSSDVCSINTSNIKYLIVYQSFSTKLFSAIDLSSGSSIFGSFCLILVFWLKVTVLICKSS